MCVKLSDNFESVVHDLLHPLWRKFYSIVREILE